MWYGGDGECILEKTGKEMKAFGVITRKKCLKRQVI